jgi:RHS repeat-associated protein
MTAMDKTVLCRYRYDPLDRLIGHIPSDTSERQRFYCKSKLATEIQGATRYSVVQHGDLLLAQQRNEGDATENTLLATDQQRSVLQTVKVNHPPQPIAYSPYGHRSIASGLLSLLGFNGERPDPVTGHYLLGNGYRAFNPVLMRFNSPDSLSPFGKGGMNSYTYCSDDPINNTDPTGHYKTFFENLIKALQETRPGQIPRPSLISSSIKTITPTSDDYVLAGFHGSTSEFIESFKQGVNHQHSLVPFNKGEFYASPDITTAAKYTQKMKMSGLGHWENYPYTDISSNPSNIAISLAQPKYAPTIYGVYVKNYHNMTPGKEFQFISNKKNYDGSILRFPKELHKDLRVTPLDSLKNPPKPWTKNLIIRTSQ